MLTVPIINFVYPLTYVLNIIITSMLPSLTNPGAAYVDKGKISLGTARFGSIQPDTYIYNQH